MPDFVTTKLTDFNYLARSHKLVDVADGTYDLIRLPRRAFIEDVWVEVSVAGSGGTPNSTVTIGFSGNKETADPDGFIDSTLGTTTSVKMLRASDDAQPASKGKWFVDGSGMLTATFTKGTTATGPSVVVFVKYSIIS